MDMTQQVKLNKIKIVTLSETLTEAEFLSICHGEGYGGWDINYWCIVEQLICEAG